jgi:hypothetical protein
MDKGSFPTLLCQIGSWSLASKSDQFNLCNAQFPLLLSLYSTAITSCLWLRSLRKTQRASGPTGPLHPPTNSSVYYYNTRRLVITKLYYKKGKSELTLRGRTGALSAIASRALSLSTWSWSEMTGPAWAGRNVERARGNSKRVEKTASGALQILHHKLTMVSFQDIWVLNQAELNGTCLALYCFDYLENIGFVYPLCLWS